MLTSPEIRAELKREKWIPTDYPNFHYECWRKWTAQVECYSDGTVRFYGNPADFVEFAAIAGIAPQGYAIVPVNLVEALKKLVGSIDDLISSSDGVAGLHRNGDLAPWDELTQGGRFESWLSSLEDARDALAAVQAKGETDG